MAGLARRLAPAAALGGLAIIIVGVADPALAGRTDATATGTTATSELTAPEAAATEETAPEETTPETTTPEPAATAEAATTCDNGEQVTGDSVMTQWGPVQVSATVAGGQVCEVHAVSWPSNDGKSQMINAYAIPQLDQMATASSGTQLDYVSGATYTSGAYAQSLQSILDAL
jgi:uncharacterized protein with FMN-binding domain